MSKIVLLNNVSLLDNIHYNYNYSNSKIKVSNSKSKVRRAAKDKSKGNGTGKEKDQERHRLIPREYRRQNESNHSRRLLCFEVESK